MPESEEPPRGSLPAGPVLDEQRRHFSTSEWLAAEAFARVRELEQRLETNAAPPAHPWWAAFLMSISWPLVALLVLAALHGNVTRLLTQAEGLLGRANQFKAGGIEIVVERIARERGVPELAKSIGKLGRPAIALLVGGLPAEGLQVIGNISDSAGTQRIFLPARAKLNAIRELAQKWPTYNERESIGRTARHLLR